MGRAEKIIKWGLYGTLFVPLLYTPFTFFPAHFGKTVIFMMLVEALAIVWVLTLQRFSASALQHSKTSAHQRSNTLTRLDVLVAVFLAVLVVTALTGVDWVNSFWGNQARTQGVFMWVHFGLWYFLMRAVWKEKKDWERAFLLTVAVGVVVSLTILFPQILPETWQSGNGGGILDNRAFAAMFLKLAQLSTGQNGDFSASMSITAFIK